MEKLRSTRSTISTTVPIPSSTLRTWNMVPHPGGKCYPRWILQINLEVENERKPKNSRFDLRFTMIFHFLNKSRIWSDGRYAHSGIRVRPKTRNKNVREKNACLKNSCLKLKAWFFRKVEIWGKTVNVG